MGATRRRSSRARPRAGAHPVSGNAGWTALLFRGMRCPTFLLPDGYVWSGLRALFGLFDDAMFALAGRAVQIMDWDRSHQYCGRCGTPTVLKPGERARQCPNCGQIHYPRIAPAVMALVQRRRPASARAFAALRAGHVQRPGRLRRARREPRALPRARSERRGRRQGREPALLLEPVLALSPFADDRFQLRLGGGGDHPRSRRDRGSRLVRPG